jgi:2-polyprenyl-3-methyl-5-hydroxy-6-metoxy-1,4-benzoquinol methylase
MDKFEISVQRFDEFAEQFAVRFMNIDAYKIHFDYFCQRLSQPGLRIFELGCGPGNVTRYLKQQLPGAAITAIDLSPNMLEIARRHLPGVDFRIMDVREISTIGIRFGGIVCSFCLPFISHEDASGMIVACRDLLEPGGMLYISTMEGDAADAGYETTSFSGASKLYFNYFRQHELEKMLEKNGFAISYLKKQVYDEPGSIPLTDLIIIANKV